MPTQPPMRGYGGQNNMPPQYPSQQQQQYMAQAGHTQQHLQPPNNPPSFMTASSQQNSFSNPLGLPQGFGANGMGGPGGGTGLASHESQRLFAGANMQTQSNRDSIYDTTRPSTTNKSSAKGKVKEVWKSNMEEEFAIIDHLIEEFPFVAVDTEFPGLIFRPMGGFKDKIDYHYQTLRANVDCLKLIQFGITLFDQDGKTVMDKYPPNVANAVSTISKRRYQHCTWVFNFQFSTEEDMVAEKQAEFLKQQGVDFDKHEREGIDVNKFGSRLFGTGLVCDPAVTWLSFHGGYDLGYLYKICQKGQMPNEETEWNQMRKNIFPNSFDIKYMMKSAVRHQSQHPSSQDTATTEILRHFETKPALETLLELFQIDRLPGFNHAGSDSYVTGRVFFEVKRCIYHGEIPNEAKGKLWGLCHLDPTDTSALTFSHSQSNGGRDPTTPLTNHTSLPGHTPSSVSTPSGFGANPRYA